MRAPKLNLPFIFDLVSDPGFKSSTFTTHQYSMYIDSIQDNIFFERKHITKQFKTKEDAIKWRLQKELEYFGIDFAP